MKDQLLSLPVQPPLAAQGDPAGVKGDCHPHTCSPSAVLCHRCGPLQALGETGSYHGLPTRQAGQTLGHPSTVQHPGSHGSLLASEDPGPPAGSLHTRVPCPPPPFTHHWSLPSEVSSKIHCEQMVHSHKPSTRMLRQKDHCTFKASLGCMASSRSA